MAKKNKKAASGVDTGAPALSKKEQKALKKAEKKEQKARRKAGRNKVFGSPIRNLIVTALVSIALGVAFLVQPSLVFTYCGYALGGLIGLVGVAYIIIYFARKPVSGVYHSEFVIGLVALLAGAYVALGGYLTGDGTTGITFTVITRIIGVLIAADGLLKLQYSVDIARMKFGGWWVALIMSVLGTALGVAIVMGYVYDLGSVLGIGARASYTDAQNAFVCGMMMLGIAFCLNGVLDIAAMIVIAVRNHRANREEAVSAAAEQIAARRAEDKPVYPAEEVVVELDEEIPAPVFKPAPAPEPAPAPVPVPEPAPAPADDLTLTPSQEIELDLIEDKPVIDPQNDGFIM